MQQEQFQLSGLHERCDGSDQRSISNPASCFPQWATSCLWETLRQYMMAIGISFVSYQQMVLGDVVPVIVDVVCSTSVSLVNWEFAIALLNF